MKILTFFVVCRIFNAQNSFNAFELAMTQSNFVTTNYDPTSSFATSVAPILSYCGGPPDAASAVRRGAGGATLGRSDATSDAPSTR